MKVMCITEEYHKHPMLRKIPVGEIVTVAGQSQAYVDGWYIEEYLYDLEGKKCSYCKIQFAPLSDIDETETEVYKNLQTQTV